MAAPLNPSSPNPQFFDSDVPLLPTRLRQGDSWQWVCSFTDYPSADYTLKFLLNSPTNRFVFPSGGITADSDGLSFDVNLTTTQTAACAPDTYDFVAVISGIAATPTAGCQETLVLQSVVVDPNLATASGAVDTRSFVKKTLDTIKAAISGDTRPDVQEYMINGRQLRKLDKMQLEKLNALYEYKYAAERRARGEYVTSRSPGFRFTASSS
jgi:hypothetical protein